MEEEKRGETVLRLDPLLLTLTVNNGEKRPSWRLEEEKR